MSIFIGFGMIYLAFVGFIIFSIFREDRETERLAMEMDDIEEQCDDYV